MQKGNIGKTEWLLLGMTAVFLCGLLALAYHDRVTMPAVETQIQVSQEEIVPEVSQLNLNTATAEELVCLPGIGEELARRILEYRKEEGDFQRIEDLMEVPGIGEKKFEALKEQITVEGTA